MGQSFAVQRLSYEALRTFADRYLRDQHPRGTPPIPIEELVDFVHKIDIVPVEGLITLAVDAFPSADMRTIYVDKGILSSRSPYRYRFSLAHELAHVLLHSEVFAAANYDDIAGWRRFVTSIPEDQYGWLEWQAYALAGLLLVPGEALAREYQKQADAVARYGSDIRKLGPGGLRILAKHLGHVFGVSSQVIDKRAVKDGLWGPDQLL